jgi:membrane protein DedA with SNARE-associated domain
LDVAAVAAIGVTATVAGANMSYAIGHRFGLMALTAPGPFAAQRLRAVAIGRPLVEKHGELAVFLNPTFPLIPNYAPLVAGALRMQWLRFFVWSTIGNVVWVCIYVVPGYFVGILAGTVRGLTIVLLIKLTFFASAICFHVIRRRRLSSK